MTNEDDILEIAAEHADLDLVERAFSLSEPEPQPRPAPRRAISAAEIAETLGLPLPTLGHSRFCSVAMTTGGPDTSDSFELEVNPANPLQYRHDGRWRDMTLVGVTVGVKEGDKVEQKPMKFAYSHLGPIVARHGWPGRSSASVTPLASCTTTGAGPLGAGGTSDFP